MDSDDANPYATPATVDVRRPAHYLPSNFSALAAATILMLVALSCSTITLVDGDYATVLLVAIACASLSLLCLALPLIRGPAGWRLAAVVIALPSLFIVTDFLRRAPHVFGGG